MIVRRPKPEDQQQLIELVGQFRHSLSELKGAGSTPSRTCAAKELEEYQEKGFPVYVAEEKGHKLVGYLVCRVDGKTVWAESLFVVPDSQRKGVGSALYSRAEELAEQLGATTVYNWVHPDNQATVSFLKGRGYDVLNLIELRRAAPNEKPSRAVKVDSQEFRY